MALNPIPLTTDGSGPEGSIPVTIAGLETGGSEVSWGDVTNKPAVIAAGADQEAARDAIGAGTSSLILGTSEGTAKEGNAVQTASQTPATAISPGTATNVQEILVELEARIQALEDSAE